MGAGLRRQSSRHLAHGGQQRQGAIRGRHRLISDGGDAGSEEQFRLRRVGSQVQISEQRLLPAQHPALLGLQLFHLHKQVGPSENLRRLGHHRGARHGVIRVRQADADAGPFLDHHLMAGLDQFPRAGGRQADAVFVILELFRRADAHDGCPLLRRVRMF